MAYGSRVNDLEKKLQTLQRKLVAPPRCEVLWKNFGDGDMRYFWTDTMEQLTKLEEKDYFTYLWENPDKVQYTIELDGEIIKCNQ